MKTITIRKSTQASIHQAGKMCGNVVAEGFWYDKVAEEKGKYLVYRQR